MTNYSIEARIEKLERQTRRFKTIIMTLLGVIILPATLLLVSAQTGKKVITAEEFQLVDQSGIMRATLDMKPDGALALSFFGRNGNLLTALGVTKNDVPGLTLLGQNNNLCALLSVMKNGAPGLGFFDQNGKIQVSLSATDKLGPKLTLYDAYGQIIWGTPSK